ncbi:hypothetical protein OVA03_12125 [Asticcacaulis sp. SL142]|uniref:hypothetical protein n=1 Tax=Asticcacaulis sp. SL142 TaxID=2995155 RepID=UPI00226C70E8|nr:hypothetical protein [Asticcacaulis sp. SL142]WAC47446.1 hypothetical protein OVA03_12125 [Asticcacaulis sp. SL142]
MRIFKGMVLTALLALSGCVTNDPVGLNDAGRKIAMGYVERALTDPMPVLRQKAETGGPYAELTLGLALISGRGSLAEQLTGMDYVRKASLASTSRNVSLYQPPVRQGLSGSVQSVQVHDPVIAGDIVSAAVACAQALGAKASIADGGAVCGGEAQYQRFLELF